MGGRCCCCCKRWRASSVDAPFNDPREILVSAKSTVVDARSTVASLRGPQEVELAEEDDDKMLPRKTISRRSSLSFLHETVRIRSRSIIGSFSISPQLTGALDLDWLQFDWNNECTAVHEGSMKVVGCLESYPGVAVASVLRGTGETLLQEEMSLLAELKASGIRTIGFLNRLLDVKHFAGSGDETAKAYLMQYFSEDMCFVYEEGEPGTEDHVLEPIRKLKILKNDEGDWTMNRDTIRVLKENNLEEEFMEDLTALVKFMVDKQVRIVDFQGVLGKNGHFYVADPLRLEPLEKLNRYCLEGVFMSSASPARQNKTWKAAFVDGLGMDLAVDVPDEL